jgi:hypothetical protein
LDEEVWEYEADPKRMHGVHCQANVGWGCELDDLCATWFEFDDSYTEEEQQEIKDYWHGDKEDTKVDGVLGGYLMAITIGKLKRIISVFYLH